MFVTSELLKCCQPAKNIPKSRCPCYITQQTLLEPRPATRRTNGLPRCPIFLSLSASAIDFFGFLTFSPDPGAELFCSTSPSGGPVSPRIHERNKRMCTRGVREVREGDTWMTHTGTVGTVHFALTRQRDADVNRETQTPSASCASSCSSSACCPSAVLSSPCTSPI